MITDLDIVMWLAAAAMVGDRVGFERARLLWSAGISTHMLVAVGSALLMIVSAYDVQTATLMPHVVLDPSRIAAQLGSGIGFVGAGAIVLDRNMVRGMTIAASIWTVAAIGPAVGRGLYFAAGIAPAVEFLIWAGLMPAYAYRARVESRPFHNTAERGVRSDGGVKEVLRVRAGQAGSA